jgi:hypothetical protein
VKLMYTRDVSKHGNNIPSTLCPFSGRFANIDDTHNLKIMDFLSESLPVVTFCFLEILHDWLTSFHTARKIARFLEPLPDPESRHPRSESRTVNFTTDIYS